MQNEPMSYLRRALAFCAAATAALAAAPALAVNPAALPDERWISISGEVQSATDDAFTLKHKNGTITVEVDDWDWYSEARPLRKGQHVTVAGRIDNDLFERRTIEARSVYVDEHKTFYYADSIDEEESTFPYGGMYWGYDGKPSLSGLALLTGTVKRVNGRELVLDTGSREVTVDTEKLGYNPLDDKGIQRIKAGDRVRVSGILDKDMFERREIDATSIISLSRK